MSVLFPTTVSFPSTRSEVSLFTRWSMLTGCSVRKMTVMMRLKGSAMYGTLNLLKKLLKALATKTLAMAPKAMATHM